MCFISERIVEKEGSFVVIGEIVITLRYRKWLFFLICYFGERWNEYKFNIDVF